ncbi:penicillin-binding protein 1C [Inquilinus sp. CAU 1745]|uniref:penicillin-binding protein 1C n=1 Tax=Inquilinus sp. CAU 1745 TaxID=3140369 RepID=UPI00325BD143
MRAAVHGVLAALVLLVGLAAWLDHRYPPALERYHQHSTMVLDAEGDLLRAYTSVDGYWRLPAAVDEVSPAYLEMLIAYEDGRFRHHAGVDPLALARAVGQWIAAGEIVSGGSTLTMQVARLLEPRPRTIRSKLIEMARAVQLELHFTKDQILGLYLTLAPFGGNLEGVRAASLAWFGKEPAALSRGEAALLVALPQSPTATRPDRFPDLARAARDKVLARMASAGVLTPRMVAEAMEEEVPHARRPMPFRAPHLADRLVAEAPPGAAIRSTIDGGLQAAAERLAERALGDLRGRANLAVLVVENDSRAVRAYVGSADFFAGARSGQVDLATAIRSPGSTLKPFIYGMAFEDRIVHPETLIEDRPRRFGDYAPTNFDPVFSGDVTVREALVRSLNIPAVAVFERVGPARLVARFRSAGAPLTLHDPAEPPGLPIALGGVGTTLYDLTTLYAALSEGGVARPLRTRLDDPGGEGRHLLTAAAAWQVTDILTSVTPPSAMVPAGYLADGRTVAYKTGTSYGFRDAWAVGYDGGHTIGVWVGRPDGTPSPDRYGRNTAAPLMFRLFHLLPKPDEVLPGPPPSDVLLAGTSDLPPHLRRFDRAISPSPVQGIALSQPLTLDFPQDGATLDLDAPTVPLIARGGERPLRWLVNGRPIDSSPLRRETEWRPAGRGLATVIVLDAEGASETATVWLE